jgi:hypothetical protein
MDDHQHRFARRASDSSENAKFIEVVIRRGVSFMRDRPVESEGEIASSRIQVWSRRVFLRSDLWSILILAAAEWRPGGEA